MAATLLFEIYFKTFRGSLWLVCLVSLATGTHFSAYCRDFYLEVLPDVLNFCD